MKVLYGYIQCEKFVEDLAQEVRSKTLRSMRLLRDYGPSLRMPFARKIGEKIFELRVNSNPPVRVFYAFHDGIIVLLHGFIKKTQKTPKREIKIATQRFIILTNK